MKLDLSILPDFAAAEALLGVPLAAGGGGSVLLAAASPERPGDRPGALLDRLEVARGGGAPIFRWEGGALETRAYGPRPAGRAASAEVAAGVLALRSVWAEGGDAGAPHPADPEALALLRAEPALQRAWPWLGYALARGGFGAAGAGGAPPRVSLAMPGRRRAAPGARSWRWTEERIGLMRSMWAQDALASEIAEALGGVSKSAVIGKLTRLGLTGGGIVHGNPRRRGGRPTHRTGAGAFAAPTAAGA